ncbi:4-oxalocrotonate tautomerase [Zoogloea oleivorans]|uniref:4-oxalocrotonate tautomerase n=1 Tax=Zoogloea oleivorans TaxID=1552750 RepID=A0A6C2CLP0_9RHOO|nr:tautomerase family protein [Zoogloea oleivorans]TYC54239.1 4-oxalocrotonate tautomerase [Zoogloea oleivorans]
MPVVNFHLVEGLTTPEQDERLLLGACRLYADVLRAPMERVRAFITPHRASQFAVAGELVAHNGLHAPYFDFIVLDGRPLDERHRLLAGFTDLLVDTLGVRRDLVRGSCRRIEPQDWAIGGEPASALRKDEVEARARAAAS